MTPSEPVVISSRDNPLIKSVRKLAQDGGAYRRQGQVWLEGDHLCRAALVRGVTPVFAIFSESYWSLAHAQWAQAAMKIIVTTDPIFASISSLESPAPMGFVLDLAALTPDQASFSPTRSSVILDRVQDAGNVGSILRSASAFGFKQVLALKGTAALWSPKVLRSAMGAHFGMQLFESLPLEAVQRLQIPMLTTSSHHGQYLHWQQLPSPCAWVMGHEGQGVCAALAAQAAVQVRIAQPGGEESLNVAAAAAICLHASAAQNPSGPT